MRRRSIALTAPAEPDARGKTYGGHDAVVMAASVCHLALLLIQPSAGVLALLFWWHANALAHPFLHRPFFDHRLANQAWALVPTLALGIPIEIWKQRHFAHHAHRRARVSWNAHLRLQLCVALLGASIVVFLRRDWFFHAWLPGMALGLVLCAIHGHYEHVAGVTNWRSRIGNWIFFNDGFHAEHHLSPSLHWSELPQRSCREVAHSRLPAAFRWLSPQLWTSGLLDVLERAALRSVRLRAWLVRSHRRALEELAPRIRLPQRIAIVGGGLFPRTALAAQELWPRAELHIIDCDPRHIERAQSMLSGAVHWHCARFDRRVHADYDVVVLPLALRDDKAFYYADPPAPVLLVHDWIWRRRGVGVVIAWILLKRLNLVHSPASRVPPAR